MPAMHARLDWARDGHDWPNRDASRFVEAGGIRWHVQSAGSGPPIVLVHGTGAATHSWRAVLPLLAPRFTVIAPDLPGHGFSEALPTRRMTLTGMASALDALLIALGIAPWVVAGHSAGAAILARMCIDRAIAPRRLVSFAGALVPLGGLPGVVFAPMAKAFAAARFVPQLVAWHASRPGSVERLLGDTGSTIDPGGARLYRRLCASPAHVAAAIAMMANWDLYAFERDLPRLPTPLDLVVPTRDRTVHPRYASRVLALLPAARLIEWEGLGHLAHEEAPQRCAELITASAEESE